MTNNSLISPSRDLLFLPKPLKLIYEIGRLDLGGVKWRSSIVAPGAVDNFGPESDVAVTTLTRVGHFTTQEGTI